MIRKPSNSCVSGSNAPSEIEDGLASSPANIERDQGVGYELRSIVSIAFRSRSSRRRKSTRFAVALITLFYQRRGLSGTSAPRSRRGRSHGRAARGNEPVGRGGRRDRAESRHRQLPALSG